MRIGDRRWWNAGGRWIWFRGRTLDRWYMFEDAGGIWFKMNREAVNDLKLNSWRDKDASDKVSPVFSDVKSIEKSRRSGSKFDPI